MLLATANSSDPMDLGFDRAVTSARHPATVYTVYRDTVSLELQPYIRIYGPNYVGQLWNYSRIGPVYAPGTAAATGKPSVQRTNLSGGCTACIG
jgi:hypothetical protein